MKKLTLSIASVIILTINAVLGQDIKQGDYVQNPNNVKFEGTWVAKKGGMQISVVLKNNKKVFVKFAKLYADEIQGEVTYSKNGKKVLNKKSVIINGMSSSAAPYKLNAYLNVENQGKGRSIYISFPNPNDLNTILITNPRRSSIEGADSRLPKEILLKRQE